MEAERPPVTRYGVEQRDGSPALVVDGQAVRTGGQVDLARELAARHLGLDQVEPTRAQLRAWRLAGPLAAALFATRSSFEMSHADLEHVIVQLGECWARGDLVWFPDTCGWCPGHVLGKRAGKVRVVTVDVTTGQELAAIYERGQLAHRDPLHQGADRPRRRYELGAVPVLRPINTTSGRLARGRVKR